MNAEEEEASAALRMAYVRLVTFLIAEAVTEAIRGLGEQARARDPSRPWTIEDMRETAHAATMLRLRAMRLESAEAKLLSRHVRSLVARRLKGVGPGVEPA